MESCSRWNSLYDRQRLTATRSKKRTHKQAISSSSLVMSPLESLSKIAKAESASSEVWKNFAMSSTVK